VIGKQKNDPCLASSIRCHGISVQFSPPSLAVDNVELEVKQGEILSLIGPSGCGKTTLLRAIAGLQSMSKGSVTLVPPAIASRGQIGFIFQQPALLPWATTLENVLLPLELIGWQTRAERLTAAIESLRAVQLGDAFDKRPHELSGGMQMRASIARALVTNPGVLLLDEPFAALDDMLRSDLGQLLLSLWESRKFTAVMVTHNISESILLSGRIAVMRNGALETVIRNPLPWPRHPSVMRTAEFGEFFGVTSDLLRGTAELENASYGEERR
jgi:ABC-type nitrate/sulfonate/bicarbonate transport system ATPase subunit